jgi:hypothetical protein
VDGVSLEVRENLINLSACHDDASTFASENVLKNRMGEAIKALPPQAPRKRQSV